MPHFTLEYSANLDARVDMGKVVEVVRKGSAEREIRRRGEEAGNFAARCCRT